MGENHRSAPRLPTNLKAHIVFDSGFLMLDCRVRNISISGLMLQVNARYSVPKEFNLMVPTKNSRYRVMLRWRSGDFIGVEILERSTVAPGSARSVRIPSRPMGLGR